MTELEKNKNFAASINNSLTANINHALRTPLNGVVGMMDLLAKTGLTKNQVQYAHIIRESTALLMLQLDNILMLAKVEEGDLAVHEEACRLKDIVKAALQPIIASATKKSISISLHYAPDVPQVIRTDPHKLQLILTNLFSCALKFAERGKIVLNISQEQIGDKNNPQHKLRFTFENSEALYESFHDSLEQYDTTTATDLWEFGEVTVSLLTVKKLLNLLGTSMRFDRLEDGHEPPFHFNLDFTDISTDLPDTLFSLLDGQRALILQQDDNTFEINTITQCLNLWGITVQTINDPDSLLDHVTDAYTKDRAIDLLFIGAEMEGKQLGDLKDKVSHIIISTGDPSHNQAWMNEFSAHLHPPVYPKELLSMLSSFYLNDPDQKERSFSEDASHLLSGVEYDPITAKIMVIEDDTTSRLYATELLEGFGCQVDTAENGHHAFTRICQHADYDLIFMDCMMPIMDGYKATQKLRQAGYTDIPIIALTANTMEQDRDKCLSVGMNDYLAKPVREQDLYSMLKKHLPARS